MYTKTTWIDKAVQYAKRYYMNWDGGNDKNLLPPFSDWTLHANAVATLPYTLSGTAQAANEQSTVFVTALPSTTYTFSTTYVNAKAYRIKSALNGTTSTSHVVDSTASSVSFTTDANANQIALVVSSVAAGAFSVTNPQLELGSSATSFTPKKMYTITQSGGTVTAAGTAVNAANLNNIEQGVFNNLILSIMGAI